MQKTEDRIAFGFLPIASALANSLAEAKVRCGVYKNTRFLEAGLAGVGDLDLLVSADDVLVFRTVMVAFGGVRGVPSPLYDNAVADREDWFIPDADGRYLHLDTSFGLRIGRKFRKRYVALNFADVAEWQLSGAPIPPVPFVGPQDEARIAVLRAVFRLPLWPGQAWIGADAESSRLLGEIFVQGQESATLDYRLGEAAVTCTVRRQGRAFVLQGEAIRRMRKALRTKDGGGLLAAPTDFIVHHARHLAYFMAQQWTAARPGRAVAKRSLEPAGVIVALIGPDGVGKSTQTARLAATFRRNFRCASVYLGSNDGDWMRFRTALRGRISRARTRTTANPPAGNRQKRQKRSGLHVLGSAVWRLVIAMQRYAAMRKAVRLAAAGAIVITDRWPQTLRRGFLDGPSVAPPPEMRLAHLLSRIEHRIYRAMEGYKPSLTIHLDCDYATSHARKPGDILPEDFERRIELMQEMRRRDPDVVVVDARKDKDVVAADLIRLAWSAVQDAVNSSAIAQVAPSHRLEPEGAVR